eukprot:XP_028337755.1 collagen alpha-1(III) chain-like [Physeter catodon]
MLALNARGRRSSWDGPKGKVVEAGRRKGAGGAGAASDKEGSGLSGRTGSAPGLCGDPEPGVRLHAPRGDQTSPAPAALKAEQTLRAPGSCPRPGSSTAAWCKAWRAGAGLVPAPEPSRNFGQLGVPGRKAGRGVSAGPTSRALCECPFLLEAEPGPTPEYRKGLNSPSENVQAPPAKAAKFDKQRLLGQAEPGTGNKAQAANTALTPLLERSARSKCPALRGTADATGTRSTVSLENLAPKPPISARARARLPHAEGALHALTSQQPSQEGLEEGPPGAREASQACSPAAKTLPGPGAKVHCEARPEVPPTVPGSRVHKPRRAPSPQPRPALPQARRAHPGSGTSQGAQPAPPLRPAPGPRRAKFNFEGPWPPVGRGLGRGPPPRRDREQPPRAYLRRSFDGSRGAPWPRGDSGAGFGPGGCAARRLPTFPPPALPGEPTGRAASAPVRTRRAVFLRGRRRRGGRRGPGGRGGRAGGGARGYPRAPGSLPAAMPRGSCCAPRWPPAGEDLRGIPWPDAGFSVGRPFCQDRSHAPSSEGLRAFATCFGQESAPGPGWGGTAGTPVRKGVPSPGGLKPSVWMRAPSQAEDAPRLFGNVGEGAASLETRCY